LASERNGKLPFGGFYAPAFTDNELLKDLRELSVPVRREQIGEFGCTAYRPDSWSWYEEPKGHEWAGGAKTPFTYWGNRSNNGVMGGYRTITRLGNASQATSKTLITCFSREASFSFVLPHSTPTDKSGVGPKSGSIARKYKPKVINTTFIDGHNEWVPYQDMELYRGFPYAPNDR
jgi:hypothetical protein